jgi:hypothetical protein
MARRKILVGGLAVVALAVPVASASAVNSGTPPGPPGVSGNPRGADVTHCAATGAGPGVTVFVRGGFPVFRCGGS